MKSVVETLNPTRVKLAVEVPFAELEPSIKSAYQKIAKQVTIPGFRKGKVPRKVIDAQIGREAVLVAGDVSPARRELVSEHPQHRGEGVLELGAHDVEELGHVQGHPWDPSAGLGDDRGSEGCDGGAFIPREKIKQKATSPQTANPERQINTGLVSTSRPSRCSIVTNRLHSGGWRSSSKLRC